MKRINTAPMEVMAEKLNGSFAIEPHEAGWADEALAMVYVREVRGPNPLLVIRPQISADGVRWMDHPASALILSAPGGYQMDLVRFGNWLRATGEITGGPADGSTAFLLDFYWVLKG